MKLKAFTANEIGDPILVYEADTQDEEFEHVAKKIKRQIQQGIEPKQIAILYRTSMVAKQMEQHLLQPLGNRSVLYQQKQNRPITGRFSLPPPLHHQTGLYAPWIGVPVRSTI